MLLQTFLGVVSNNRFVSARSEVKNKAFELCKKANNAF
jgi:hypothetical protein